ncbi:hypothetical protein [Enterococcus crotali]|uniref:hypothetical protein n=1 Tax=Enterococcus crotali TaxID=1453587 RepID=UPI00047248F8|nr:hypothetical protein [Enterococcus crotali]
MALVHEFTIFKNEENIDYNNETKKHMIKIEDYLILYLSDSLKWVPSHWENMSNQKEGLNYYGTTIFDGVGIKKFLNIIKSWKNLFENAPDSIELSTEVSVEDGIYLKENIETKKLLKQLDTLISLSENALNKNGLLVHFGI